MIALDRADFAVIIACTSAVAAVASLSWQIYHALRVDRAKVTVTVAMNMGLFNPATGENMRAVIVNATNDGKRATEISFLALTLVPRTPWYRRLTRRQRGKVQASLLLPGFDDPLLQQGQIPKVLDVGGSTHVVYRRDHVDTLIKQEKAVRIYGTANVSAGATTSKVVRL